MDITTANEAVGHDGHERNVPSKAVAPVMRAHTDDLSVWQCARRFKMVSLIAMAAAFSASLDGYRKTRIPWVDMTDAAEINLNGGIIANKGFIRQMATEGTTVIEAKYMSAWGGIQSAGQFVGQVVRILSSMPTLLTV